MKSNWSKYYKKTQLRDPSLLLKMSLNNFKAPGVAYDLGAGSGVDTRYLIEQGWKVTAIDKEKNSIEQIKINCQGSQNLTVLQNNFENLSLKTADLIYGRFAFPFCHPKSFNKFWKTMTSSLNANGVLAGVLFGTNDSWVVNKNMTFHTQKEILKLFTGFEVLFFDEFDQSAKTALGHTKNWHTYTFILRPF
jgi:SAM-dependent methyltransferase